jgi:hypothetical protein
MVRLLTRVTAIVVAVLATTACESPPQTMLSPTASAPPAPVSAHLGSTPLFRALNKTDGSSATQESGFQCGLLMFGSTEQSHATRSASGNETLHCSGETPVPPPGGATVIEGTPCVLHFSREVTTDSRLVITPSGRVILTCKSQR